MPHPDIRRSDKVRISTGPHAGQRAIVEKATQVSVQVRLQDSKRRVSVGPDAIANYSAAARRAWKTMPARKVGRPRGQTVDRISVTVRLDRTLWDRFRKLEAKGDIDDRAGFLETALTHAIRRLGGRKNES
jgi:hypothetical protein